MLLCENNYYESSLKSLFSLKFLFHFIIFHEICSDQTGSIECPRCDEEFPVKDIQRDKIAHKRLLKLEIICPHECETEMPLRDLDKHEEECPNVSIDCLNKKFGCLRPVQRSKIAEHLAEECEYRRVSCKHCGQQTFAHAFEVSCILPIEILKKWIYVVSWEPEGHYHFSKMFHWEPEGRFHHRLLTVIVPFWFSMEHLWTSIAPFWLSTDDLIFFFYVSVHVLSYNF